MTALPTARDYSLIGRDGRLAVENGLAAAEWYHTDIPRKEMKALMQREDGPAIRDTLIWLGLFLVFGGLAIALWPSWWAVLPLFCLRHALRLDRDSRWHECGHGTAFKTRWMNDAVYQIACFMMMREPEIWRWSHTRHHTDTIIVGRDPEIARDAAADDLRRSSPTSSALRNAPRAILGVIRHARPAHRGGEDLRPRDGVAQGLPHRPHLARDPPACRSRSRSPSDPGCRCCWSARCRRCTAPGSRVLPASPSMPAWPRTCSTTG